MARPRQYVTLERTATISLTRETRACLNEHDGATGRRTRRIRGDRSPRRSPNCLIPDGWRAHFLEVLASRRAGDSIHCSHGPPRTYRAVLCRTARASHGIDRRKTECSSRLLTASRPFPLLPAEDKDKDPATYNILVKKTGPMNVTWNGVGIIQVPRGKDNKESNNVTKTVLLQRKEVLMAEVSRLYPKMTGKLDFVIQMFEDPYADPVDMEQTVPEGIELVPAEVKWLTKGKRYPF